MFTKAKTFLVLTLLFSLLSCEKSKSISTLSTVPYTATLKVTVLKNYLNAAHQPTDSALSHTFVYVYNSEYDRNNNNPASYSGITDSAGLVVFTGLTQTEYYLHTYNAQFGTKDDNVNTPLNAIALEEIDY